MILNIDLVEETMEHYQMALEGSHTLCQALPHAWMYQNHHWINMLATSLYATIVSGLIVHAVPVSGCMILVMFVMFWWSRSVATESV